MCRIFCLNYVDYYDFFISMQHADKSIWLSANKRIYMRISARVYFRITRLCTVYFCFDNNIMLQNYFCYNCFIFCSLVKSVKREKKFIMISITLWLNKSLQRRWINRERRRERALLFRNVWRFRRDRIAHT